MLLWESGEKPVCSRGLLFEAGTALPLEGVVLATSGAALPLEGVVVATPTISGLTILPWSEVLSKPGLPQQGRPGVKKFAESL